METIKKIVLEILRFCYGVWGTPGSLLDLPRHFLDHFENFLNLEKLLLRTYFEPLDRSRMIPTKSEKISDNMGKSRHIFKQL